MSSLALMRWSGLAALVGGVLLVVGDLLGLTLSDDFAETATSGTFIVQQLLFLFGTVLVLGGLCGLYVRQLEAAGVLGLVGFLLAFLGTTLLASLSWTQAIVVPSLAAESPEFLETEPLGSMLLSLAFTVGWLVFGIATLRAGVYPRAAAIVLIIGAVLTFFGFILPASAFIFGTAVAWLGIHLFAERSAAEGQLPRV